MTRYCIKLDKSFSTVVIHEQSCRLYHDAHPVAQSYATDLGEFADSQTALRKARAVFRGAALCESCCAAPAAPAIEEARGAEANSRRRLSF